MWEDHFLWRISAPATPTNVQACTLWADSEGVLADNNPFACTGKFPGATRCIAQCGTVSEVWAYDTIEHGCDANARFLIENHYSGILNAFRADAGLEPIWQAINSSPWCRGCQGGLYPIQLYRHIHDHPAQEEEPMTAVLTADGHIKVYAAGAGSRAGHLLEFTRDPTSQANSVIDITAQIGGTDPYTVTP